MTENTQSHFVIATKRNDIESIPNIIQYALHFRKKRKQGPFFRERVQETLERFQISKLLCRPKLQILCTKIPRNEKTIACKKARALEEFTLVLIFFRIVQ
jgi:hypothetical protein